MRPIQYDKRVFRGYSKRALIDDMAAHAGVVDRGTRWFNAALVLAGLLASVMIGWSL